MQFYAMQTFVWCLSAQYYSNKVKHACFTSAKVVAADAYTNATPSVMLF